jgi:hypothetical protein
MSLSHGLGELGERRNSSPFYFTATRCANQAQYAHLALADLDVELAVDRLARDLNLKQLGDVDLIQAATALWTGIR